MKNATKMDEFLFCTMVKNLCKYENERNALFEALDQYGFSIGDTNDDFYTTVMDSITYCYGRDDEEINTIVEFIGEFIFKGSVAIVNHGVDETIDTVERLYEVMEDLY